MQVRYLSSDHVEPVNLSQRTIETRLGRYDAAIAGQLGGRVTEVVVNHRARRFGESKYGLSRTFKVLADLVHLRRVMREALVPPPAGAPLYEIAERLD